MKLETFFENFEQFADAPNAVAKMRELVLQLAVRGCLTEQSDEESSRLQLARAEDFRIQRGKRSESDLEDVPFLIPNNWGWVAVGDSMNMINGRAFKPEEWSTEGTPIIRIQNLNNSAAAFNYCKLDLDSKIHVHDGDFLISWSGTPGTSFGAFIWNRGFAYLNQHIFRCELVEGIFEKKFLRLAVNARLDEMISHAQGAVGLRHITKGKLEGIRMPLPPLAEQKRIVAKVDELMALCDRLEAQQQERDTRHAALARASLARFSEIPTPANLDFLFHPSYTIPSADLRKSILTLAVQGKLVTQDPDDEPAEVWFSRFCKSPSGSDSEIGEPPFVLPEGWLWLRVADVFEVAGGIQKTPHRTPRGNAFPYLGVGNVYRGRLDLSNIKEFELEPGELERRHLEPDDLLIIEGNGSFNEIGRCAKWNGEIANCVHQNHVIRCRPCDARIASFVLLFLNSPNGTETMQNLAITSSGLYSLSVGKIRRIEIPLPPLAEQRRIVVKVDQLMALVDQLESQLAEAKSRSAALLEAIVHELLNPSAEVIDLASYRAAIGCYTISKMSQRPYFGRTAAMKTLYLAEAHVGLNLGFQPEREAAGPLDLWLYSFEKEAEQKGWFTAVENAANGKMKVEYQPGKMIAAQTAQAESQLAQEQRKEFDRLLSLLSGKKTEEVEIIATLFAAWNDFLIDGHAPSDDEIVSEVRENWHVKKERFTPALLRQWLGWLRKNNLVPQGRLPRTVQQSKLSLN